MKNTLDVCSKKEYYLICILPYSNKGLNMEELLNTLNAYNKYDVRESKLFGHIEIIGEDIKLIEIENIILNLMIK